MTDYVKEEFNDVFKYKYKHVLLYQQNKKNIIATFVVRKFVFDG